MAATQMCGAFFDALYVVALVSERLLDMLVTASARVVFYIAPLLITSFATAVGIFLLTLGFAWTLGGNITNPRTSTASHHATEICLEVPIGATLIGVLGQVLLTCILACCGEPGDRRRVFWLYAVISMAVCWAVCAVVSVGAHVTGKAVQVVGPVNADITEQLSTGTEKAALNRSKTVEKRHGAIIRNYAVACCNRPTGTTPPTRAARGVKALLEAQRSPLEKTSPQRRGCSDPACSCGL